jgi:PEP-CTERM motif
MPRIHTRLFAFLCFFTLYIGSSSVVRADTVVITFTNPTQTLVAGSSGTFSGSLTNVTASPVTISGTLLTFTPGSDFPGTLIGLNFEDAYLDLVSPLGNGPLTLAPGESTGVIPMFRFDLNPAFGGPSPVIVNGLFIVSQGDVFVPANELGRASWSITVLPNPNAEEIPEPATALLLGSGLFGLATRMYRKFRAEN